MVLYSNFCTVPGPEFNICLLTEWIGMCFKIIFSLMVLQFHELPFPKYNTINRLHSRNVQTLPSLTLSLGKFLDTLGGPNAAMTSSTPACDREGCSVWVLAPHWHLSLSFWVGLRVSCSLEAWVRPSSQGGEIPAE
jgi:hypothetical protein